MALVMDALSPENVAVLFVEHDMDIVRRYASRVVVFYEGRVLAAGEPDEALYQEDVKRFVAGNKK